MVKAERGRVCVAWSWVAGERDREFPHEEEEGGEARDGEGGGVEVRAQALVQRRQPYLTHVTAMSEKSTVQRDRHVREKQSAAPTVTLTLMSRDYQSGATNGVAPTAMQKARDQQIRKKIKCRSASTIRAQSASPNENHNRSSEREEGVPRGLSFWWRG